MRRALVCGAGGFIGSHLVKYLKQQDYNVIGLDIKRPEFRDTEADEFILYDLREPSNYLRSIMGGVQEVYQLAADMGGMGFIHSAEADIMVNNVMINANAAQTAVQMEVERYFFSSSVCVYPDMPADAPQIDENAAYPANPHNEYGWEKLYSERMALTLGRHSNMQVRIARFENCYGEYGTWQGGREKAPAALCRKVAEDNTIEVWGDGQQVRNFIYVNDLVRGIYTLMHSHETRPTNIGTEQRVTIDTLVQTIADVAGKRVKIKHVDGPVGVQARHFSHERMWALGWSPRYSLHSGISRLYPWVAEQVVTCQV